MSNELSPEQRDRLARLIVAELRRARDAALAAGAAPDGVEDTLEERRRALEPGTGDDDTVGPVGPPGPDEEH